MHSKCIVIIFLVMRREIRIFKNNIHSKVMLYLDYILSRPSWHCVSWALPDSVTQNSVYLYSVYSGKSVTLQKMYVICGKVT